MSTSPTFYAWQHTLNCARSYKRTHKELHAFSPRIHIRNAIFTIPTATDPDAIDDTRLRGLWDLHNLILRSDYMARATNAQLRTVDPYPSSPTRPAQHSIAFSRMDDNRKYQWNNFFGIFAAKKWVELLIGDEDTDWQDDSTLLIPSLNLRVHSSTLSDIMEHEYTKDEKEWQVTEPHLSILMAARNTRARDWTDDLDKPLPKRRSTDSEDTSPADETPKAPKAEKAPKAAKPAGLVSLPDILSGTDIDAKEARTILRKTSTPKPAHGRWEWPKAEADAIKALIMENRK